jgi:inhibitor of KinA sporulation pathway (predicted exonuclease)
MDTKTRSSPPDIFTSIDLEMNQPSKKIIEIGACVFKLSTGEILDKFTVFVNPKEQLSEFITKLTSIQQNDVDNGVSISEAYQLFRSFHDKHSSFCNLVQWGHGDSQLLYKQIKDENPDFNNWGHGRRDIDVKTIYVASRLAFGKNLSGGLAKAMTKFGIKFEGKKHRAVDDSVNTARIMIELLKRIREKQIVRATND